MACLDSRVDSLVVFVVGLVGDYLFVGLGFVFLNNTVCGAGINHVISCDIDKKVNVCVTDLRLRTGCHHFRDANILLQPPTCLTGLDDGGC